jgi:hypothetical protein
MAEREYTRLTRARMRWSTFNTGVAAVSPMAASVLSSRSSLWLGKDHLLGIDTNGYTENYKRFYFRDIQAFTLRRTNRRMILTIILALIISLLVSIAIGVDETVASIIFGSVAALFLAFLVINLAKGPTCVCYLRTAVQTENLPSLNRVRRARKILERIRPLIAATQGQLTREEIPARMQELMAAAPATAPTAPAPETQRYIVDDLNLPPRIVS